MKVSLYRTSARNTEFRCVICVNETPDTLSICPSLCFQEAVPPSGVRRLLSVTCPLQLPK